MAFCMIRKEDVLTTAADIAHLDGAIRGGLALGQTVIDYVQLYREGITYYTVIINEEDVGDVLLSATAENFSARLNDLLRTLNTAVASVDGEALDEQKKLRTLSAPLPRRAISHPLAPLALPLLLFVKWSIYLTLVQRERNGYVDFSTDICEDLEWLRDELQVRFIASGKEEPAVVRSVESVDHALKRLRDSFASLVRVHGELKEELRPKLFG